MDSARFRRGFGSNWEKEAALGVLLYRRGGLAIGARVRPANIQPYESFVRRRPTVTDKQLQRMR